MKRRQTLVVRGALLAAVFVVLGGAGAEARHGATPGTTNWLSFGNTVDQMRHSP